jgi:hypothetical protein
MKCVVSNSVLPCFSLRVESGGRFVEEQQFRIVDQRAGQRQPAFHAAGKRLDAGVGAAGQTGKFEQRRDAFQQRRIGYVEITAEHPQVFADGEIGIEVVELRHHANAFAGFSSLARHVMAEHADAAAVGAGQAETQSQGRGLARAIGTEQAETFAGLQREVNAAHDFLAAVGLAQSRRNEW